MQSITRIAPHRTALTVALVIASLTLIAAILMLLAFGLAPGPAGRAGMPMPMGFPVGMAVLMPLFQFVIGYLVTALLAWVYNGVARLTGGITVELTER
ncbi:MAG: DUF3566 domain-containing protein [Pseudohongiellaceae bacterium]